MTGGGHVNIGTGLVGFGFESELETVFAVEAIFAEKVYGFAEAFYGFIGAATGIGLDAFAAAP
jgi:hypothetical protein